MKRTLHIMRGLPCSGKSTAAVKIVKSCDSARVVRYGWSKAEDLRTDSHQFNEIISTDSFWVGPDGKYRFDGGMLQQAREWCYARVERAMLDLMSCIVLDNTNCRYREFINYTTLAEQYNYRFEVHMVGGISDEDAAVYMNRCSHPVPEEIFKHMQEVFEL